jgi:putative transposase
MQNGHVESFHGRLRDECLNASWFHTLNDVRSTPASWRREYNCKRAHSSLDYDGCEIISKQIQNRETAVIGG